MQRHGSRGCCRSWRTATSTARVEGINDLQQAVRQAKYGPGDYMPDHRPSTYWTFRLMIGFGLLAGLLAVLGLWLTAQAAGSRQPRWFWLAAVAGRRRCRSLANTAGWIFTEMGRQPWIVFERDCAPRDGVSPPRRRRRACSPR